MIFEDDVQSDPEGIVTSNKHREKICEVLPSSFRDPSGFVFRHEGELYRQVNRVYRDHYQLLMRSGLYAELVEQGMLMPHEEVEGPVADESRAWCILKPEPVTFISYPYEWCFSQLKDAALLTLDIQSIAMQHGMCLKDASAYNVQFHKGKPIFIDTLSFEPYVEGVPWIAYRQFCQHFLAPLALMAKCDVRLGQLLRVYIDGFPLDLSCTLLPRRSLLNFGLMMHLHLHSRSQKSFADSHKSPSETALKFSRVSKLGLIGLLDGLRKTIEKLKWEPGGTEWGNYYNDTNYSDDAFDIKRRHISSFLDDANPKEIWDLGANTGLFSRIASDRDLFTLAFDIDPSAVEINYRQVRKNEETSLLPLLFDMTNPSPGLGWNSSEREAIVRRGPADCVMALALLHHISISNNVPFEQVASFFSELCHQSLIIEFVPKSDSQVKRLLRSREDIFPDYDQDHFEEAFTKYFFIRRAEAIEGSERILYLMTKKPNP
jgi:hypothetical protein